MSKTLYRTENQVLRTLLREARLSAGLTQEDISRALGRSQTLVSDIERGVRRLDLVELLDLCDTLGLDLVEFVAEFRSAVVAARTRRRKAVKPGGGTPRRRS